MIHETKYVIKSGKKVRVPESKDKKTGKDSAPSEVTRTGGKDEK